MPAPVSNAAPAAAPVASAPASGGAPAPAAPPASQANPTTYSSTPAPSAGGDISDAVSRITAYAQQQMTNTQNEMTAMFNSEGGSLDPAKLQIYQQRMSTYQMSMEMAANIQEKRDRAIEVWTQMR